MKWKVILIILYIAIYGIYCKLEPKKVSHYCIDDQCISIVRQAAGRDSYIRIYQDRIFFRFQLERRGYIELPIETHALISKRLSDNKFIVSAQALPVKSHGYVDNIKFNQIKDYSEGDAENIPTYDLEYRNLY